ncbi:GIY-YIG nuclease family protein [Limnoraphis robusta]|uniref:GIY-YIG nuclease family protein n=1 Tax=Limnoraphis robusta CCNP1315 TaxID=3110306 RepID=A0ABU5TWZ8_9CYAN|nr:GIY-YIG nuclease family protein [Limnoraphis robusta]MEA5519252.1 GIY-YIG nuclease family protein [Limnoraphis robusta CCNP1315]MEA5547121.1 GIY-YIG nuclease family protein [Limnoraphis robusta CCNP1324]
MEFELSGEIHLGGMKVQNKQQSDDISSMDKPQTGYVYLYSSFPELNRCKIGITKNYQRRFQELKNQAPCKTHILDCVESNNYKEDESKLHQMFQHRRKHGEWFEFDSEDQALGLFREYFRVREIYEQKLNVLKDEIVRLKIKLEQEKDKNNIIKVLKDQIDDLEIELDCEKEGNKLLEEIVDRQNKLLAYHQIEYPSSGWSDPRFMYCLKKYTISMIQFDRVISRSMKKLGIF